MKYIFTTTIIFLSFVNFAYADKFTDKLYVLTNEARDTELVIDKDLELRASLRAKFLCEHKQWSHNYWEVFFAGRTGFWRGENLAKDFKKPEDVITAWVNSESHKKNLVSERYHNIGIARQCNIIVQLFD